MVVVVVVVVVVVFVFVASAFFRLTISFIAFLAKSLVNMSMMEG